MKIENKYDETKLYLTEKIIEGAIEFVEDAGSLDSKIRIFGGVCYFCRKPMRGKVGALLDRGEIRGFETICYFPVDIQCYNKNRRFSAGCSKNA